MLAATKSTGKPGARGSSDQHSPEDDLSCAQPAKYREGPRTASLPEQYQHSLPTSKTRVALKRRVSPGTGTSGRVSTKHTTVGWPSAQQGSIRDALRNSACQLAVLAAKRVTIPQDSPPSSIQEEIRSVVTGLLQGLLPDFSTEQAARTRGFCLHSHRPSASVCRRLLNLEGLSWQWLLQAPLLTVKADFLTVHQW